MLRLGPAAHTPDKNRTCARDLGSLNGARGCRTKEEEDDACWRGLGIVTSDGACDGYVGSRFRCRSPARPRLERAFAPRFAGRLCGRRIACEDVLLGLAVQEPLELLLVDGFVLDQDRCDFV